MKIATSKYADLIILVRDVEQFFVPYHVGHTVRFFDFEMLASDRGMFSPRTERYQK